MSGLTTTLASHIHHSALFHATTKRKSQSQKSIVKHHRLVVGGWRKKNANERIAHYINYQRQKLLLLCYARSFDDGGVPKIDTGEKAASQAIVMAAMMSLILPGIERRRLQRRTL